MVQSFEITDVKNLPVNYAQNVFNQKARSPLPSGGGSSHKVEKFVKDYGN